MFKDLTLFIRWTWPIRPSSDPVTYLLKYYPVLRKTAKGNFTSNDLRDFFFSALCSPLHHSLDGISDQCFQTSAFRSHQTTKKSFLTIVILNLYLIFNFEKSVIKYVSWLSLLLLLLLLLVLLLLLLFIIIIIISDLNFLYFILSTKTI